MSKELREAAEETMEDVYFVYDPDAGYFETFKTEAEALDDAKESISTHLDGEWDTDVENIIVGKITHVAKQTNLQKRPSADKLDENGCDEDGVLWSHDFHCDYEMIGIKAVIQAEPVEQEPTKYYLLTHPKTGKELVSCDRESIGMNVTECGYEAEPLYTKSTPLKLLSAAKIKLEAQQQEIDKLKEKLSDEENRHAELQARCFDNGYATFDSIFGEIDRLKAHSNKQRRALRTIAGATSNTTKELMIRWAIEASCDGKIT